MRRNIIATTPPKPIESAETKIIKPTNPINIRNKLNNKQPPNDLKKELSINDIQNILITIFSNCFICA